MSKQILCVVVLCAGLSAQVTVRLRSGNGAVRGRDAAISMLVGPQNSPFAERLTARDFQAARNGRFAIIDRPNVGWISGLPTDAAAQWVKTDPKGHTGLFAISFQLSSVPVAARLVIRFAVDHELGDSQNAPIFVNGRPVPGAVRSGDWTREYVMISGDVATLLTTGTNWLYFNAADRGSGAGLMFSAELMACAAPGSCADHSPFGSTCVGQGGVPTTQVATLPFLGGSLAELIQGLPASQSGVHLLGVSNRRWGSLPLPLDLTPFGMTGCFLYVSGDALTPFVSTVVGTHVVRLPVPSIPTLAGVDVYTQSLVFRPGANPANRVVTAGCHWRIGR